MKARSYTAVRGNLAKTMEEVCDDHELIVITRKNEKSVRAAFAADEQMMAGSKPRAFLCQSPTTLSSPTLRLST